MSSNAIGILIIIFIVIVGIATGGDIFRSGPGLNLSSEYSGQYSDSDKYGDAISNDPSLDPNRSDFVGKVFIDNVNNPGTFNERVQISTSFTDDTQKVNVTGWRIRSTVTGAQIVIGGAANLPIENVVDRSPITLSDNSRVIVSPGSSPVGTSFRINKCTGFFEEDHNFVPTLPNQCPYVSDDAPAPSKTIDDECLDYIGSLPRCTTFRDRDFPKDEDGVNEIGNACRTFLLTKVNYPTCVANHVTDTDFYKKEWRVYTGQRGIYTREQREKLVLLDNLGKVVDYYSY
jgi:hypothetical protein